MPSRPPAPPLNDALGWEVNADLTAMLPGRRGMQLALQRPEAGLGPAVDPGNPTPDPAADRLLGLDLRGAATMVDHWARGTDLTAVYEPSDPRCLRATAMWRPLPCQTRASANVDAWEVILSAQTSLLESDPALAVVSDVAADEALGMKADMSEPGGEFSAGQARWLSSATADATDIGAVLLRREGTHRGTSVLLAVHPADLRSVTVQEHAGRVRVSCWLFSSTLEKGVLLRSRVLAAIGPSADDTLWAADLLGAYRRLPPMLDT
jgi:hypothetical protein